MVSKVNEAAGLESLEDSIGRDLFGFWRAL